MHQHVPSVPIYTPYPPYVRYYPINYPGGYEPAWWQRYEEKFEPRWLQQRERQLGIMPGREPLWWELYEEQFEPRWLQFQERRLGIPQPYDPRYDAPRWF